MEPEVVTIAPTDWAGIALVISSSASFITAIGGIVMAIWMKHVAHNTNSIKDELVAATRKSAFAEGVAEEKRSPS